MVSNVIFLKHTSHNPIRWRVRLTLGSWSEGGEALLRRGGNPEFWEFIISCPAQPGGPDNPLYLLRAPNGYETIIQAYDNRVEITEWEASLA